MNLIIYGFNYLAIPPTYCEACEFTLRFLDYELKKDKSKEAVTNALENVCNVAPQTIRDNCNSIVETYGVYLIDLMANEDPLVVCQNIKLCQANTESDKKKVVGLVDLVAAKEVKNPQAVTDRLKLEIIKPEVGDFQCTLCVYIAEIIDGLLKQNKTDEEIRAQLEKVCNFFPGPIKDQVN